MLISCAYVCMHVRERERQCGGREEREIGAGRRERLGQVGPQTNVHI